MSTKTRTLAMLVAGLLAGWGVSATADTQRGRLLYENHCQACHTSVVHIREQRKAKSPAELRAFILRWSGELKLQWSDQELADVYQYLNNLHYKFPVETPAK
jgi:mono/diheme cytochrome c family protein